MTASEKVMQDIEKLGETALRIKTERDALLAACKRVYAEIDDRYDVDYCGEDTKEYPCSGAGEWMRVLKAAIEKAEGA